MDNIVGPPVTGENFFYAREKDVDRIISMLSDGNSILLSGLRRIGKSSIMKSVEKKLPDNWKVNYYDVQDKAYPSDLFSVLLKSIDPSAFNNFLSKSRVIPNRIINSIKKNFKNLGAGKVVGVELNETIIDYWEPLTKGIEDCHKVGC